MATVISGSAASFPQTSLNRLRSAAIEEISSYAGGGGNRGDIQQRALACWASAINEFNDVAWVFNRMTQDITLVTTQADYTLNATFRNPIKATLLDTNNKPAGGDPLIYIPFRRWIMEFPDQSGTGEVPEIYTVRNAHETGLLTFDPIPTGTFPTYPKVRLHYHRRIVLPAADGDYLNVPAEVDEAILHLAVARMISKIRSFTDAREAYALARNFRINVEQAWRDYEDFT